jgi:hypothetical protein
MKKILFILICLVSLPIFGQTYMRLNRSSVTGTDTTLYLVSSHPLLTIDFTTASASTSTLDVGYSDDRVSFVSASVSGVTFPVTLSKVTYTKTANTYTRNRIMFEHTDQWPGTYKVLKFTFTGVTSGYYDIWY